MNANLYIIFQGQPGCGKSKAQQIVEGALSAEGFTIVRRSFESPVMLEVRAEEVEDSNQTKLPLA